MTKRRWFPRTARSALSATGLVLVAAVVVLSGCSGGDTGQGEDDSGSEKSPLAKYLGYSPNQPGSGEGAMMVTATRGETPSEADKAKMRRVQERIATCMREQGFEYVPEAPPKDEAPGGDDADPASLSPKEFAKKYGYGITTLAQGTPGEGGGDASANDRIRDRLSKDAQRAYDEALLGDAAAGSGGGAVTMERSDGGAAQGTSRGCEGKASEEVYGKPKRFDPKSQEALLEDLESLGRRITGDPKVKKAESAYADCLADAGHPGYVKPGDAQQAIWKKYDGLAAPNDGGEAKAVDPKKLAPVKNLELELAPADLKCREEHYDGVYHAARLPMEKEFVAQHKEELERYQEAVGQGSDGTVVGPVG